MRYERLRCYMYLIKKYLWCSRMIFATLRAPVTAKKGLDIQIKIRIGLFLII
jgi:hypothetical protein